MPEQDNVGNRFFNNVQADVVSGITILIPDPIVLS